MRMSSNGFIIHFVISLKADRPYKATVVYNLATVVYSDAKQKHPRCKKGTRPIRSSITNRYVRPKTLISVEAKKLLIKNLF